VAGAELRAAIGIAPLEGRGDARRPSGAADAGIAVENRLDRVDPQSKTSSREPFSKKRQRLEGLGVKGHRRLSEKIQGEGYRTIRIEPSPESKSCNKIKNQTSSTG